MSENNPAYTVRCFDDKDLTKHAPSIELATLYANELLRDGHKCKIYPYRKPRTYTDVLVARAQKEGVPR